ncbi:alpha/beta hydrolase [Sorangium sp. So ce381]|uniref:alpha/beta hydrolase n=1 Tax=Sorangium sp. So ce381 TaxID=3133307 RepID=UPI003F5B672B
MGSCFGGAARWIAALLGALAVALCACSNTTDAPGRARAPAPDGAALDAAEPGLVPAAPTPAVTVAATALPEPAPWPRARPPRVETDWCIDGVDALDEETCYVLPDAPTRTLLLYLHGIVPPGKESEQKTNVETVVSRAARRAGVAALIPRGKVGLAPKGYASWRGWPTGERAYEEHAAALVAVFAEKRRKLEEITGVSFSRVYVAGSSSGAYFAAALALRGGIDADGFGAMSGGGGHATTQLATLAPRPFYIGFGANDTVGGSARALAGVLRGAGWPVRVAVHPFGHGAKEVYLDEAFAFWREHEAR